MRTTVERKALERALEYGGMAAGRNRALPALEMVKIVMKNGKMRITSFSGAVGIGCGIPLLDDGPAGGCVFLTEPKRLLQAVKMMEGEALALIADADAATLTVEHDTGTMTVGIAPPDDFPEFGLDKAESELHMDGSLLAEWARLAEKFSASDEIRPVLNAMLLYSGNAEVGFCASDSRILVNDAAAVPDVPEMSAIIPKQALPVMQKCFKSCKDVRMRKSARCAVFSAGGTSMYVQLVTGKYPDFGRIMPKSHEVSVVLPREQVCSAIRRVTVGMEGRCSISLSGDGGTLVMEARDVRSGVSSVERCICGNMPDIRVGVTGPSLLLAAESSGGAEISLGMNGPTSPILVTGDGRRRILVMPVGL